MNRATRSALSLIAALFCLWLAVTPRVNPLVGTAERFQRDIAIATGTTYISLRAINAALSFAQEAEVGGSVVVTGTIQPLKWLEPVDDTVERVSALVFGIAVITAILSMSLAPVAATGFVLMAIALAGRCTCEMHRHGWPGAPPGLRRVVHGVGTLGLAFALGLPAASALGVWAGDLLTHAAAAEANATITAISEQALALVGQGEDRGWRETYEAYKGAAGAFWNSADDLLAASLSLTGIFVLRMIVLPTLILLVFVALLRQAAARV
ncbi:hypothetical protein [Pseudooceanicola aestuarii]|uniref:hypothetical protein n=1 Tax=Pseudooceanicola aestuarii TaxID=2697319 RepID=UPI0013D3049D|nr:hypothetical protein [Pseudooceanicola aestuarii]